MQASVTQNGEALQSPVRENSTELDEAPTETSSNKRKKKMMKKAAQGLICCDKNYIECLDMGIKATSSISTREDGTRGSSAHDLNAFEIRDFIRCIYNNTGGGPLKHFEVIISNDFNTFSPTIS